MWKSVTFFLDGSLRTKQEVKRDSLVEGGPVSGWRSFLVVQQSEGNLSISGTSRKVREIKFISKLHLIPQLV